MPQSMYRASGPTPPRLAGALAACLLAVLPALAGDLNAGPGPVAARAVQRIQAEADGGVTARFHRATGVARLLRFDAGTPPLTGLDKTAAPEARAREALQRFSDAFGIDAPTEQLEWVRTRSDALGTTSVEYRQIQAGVEVFGARIRVHFHSDGALAAVNGAFIPELSGLGPTPRLGATEAGSIALRDVAARVGRTAGLKAVRTRLVFFRTNLARGIAGQNHLAWEVEVGGSPDVREFVYIDAHKGGVIDRIAGIHDALDRRAYDGGYDEASLVWSEGDAFPTGEADIDNLVDFAEDTYNLFSSLTGGTYLSFDGADATMDSVNNSPFIGCPNASWNGSHTNYCAGVTGDDTVAHEWAHGYTERTHGLIYQWQPGALNESYSDIWGEIVDLLNAAGTDAPAPVRGDGECSTLGRGPAPELTVSAPTEIAGGYFAGGAAFNPQPPVVVSGDVEVAFDGVDAHGCQPFVGFTAGRVALVDRGNCPFTTKVLNAQSAGAVAVLVVNAAESAFSMSGTDGSITIPSLMVAQSTGTMLREASGPVSITISLQEATETSLRWLAGEDDPAFGGSIRDMWSPTCFSDPGKVSDLEYQCGAGDSGGVHSNSGVPNHAFALLIDGGNYNGRTVLPISLTEAAHIYWRAQTVYQTPTTDFADHADALEMACADLIGAPLLAPDTDDPAGVVSGEVLSAADCAQVAEAVAAVEFRTEPTQCNFQPLLAADAPPLCGGGDPVDLLNDDWESGLGGWTVGTRDVADPSTFDTPDWAVVSPLPSDRAGSAAFVADLRIGNCADDLEAGVLFLESPDLVLPGGIDTPRLAFDHWVATENGWDGGNVKISVNGGPFGLVPGEAFVFNAYPNLLNVGNNPLSGEPAFTGTDGGSLFGSWGQSQIELGSLALPGDTIRLRFEMGLDGCNGVTGWYVDDVTVFACSCVETDWYQDTDGDAYGNPAASITACASPPGFVADASDCEDGDASVNPGATETCNDGLDNDCNDATADLFDADGDAFTCEFDCDDANVAVWTVPGETGTLTWDDPQTLAWVPAIRPGGTVYVHDVLRSSDAADFVGPGVCADSDTSANVFVEAGVPAGGELWSYLVRTKNACPGGSGSLGTTTSGTQRTAPACPE